MTMALAGCATGGSSAAPSQAAKKGMSDDDGIKAALENWKVGMESKDIAKLGAGISDKFNHYEWGNKQQMLDFLKSQFDQGTLDGAKINAANAKRIENGVATVYPVELVASFGTATINSSCQKKPTASGARRGDQRRGV